MVKLSTFNKNKLFLKSIAIKLRITKLKMRFKVSMVNDQGKFHEETVIASNEKEAKWNVQIFNPRSKILEANWVYK